MEQTIDTTIDASLDSTLNFEAGTVIIEASSNAGDAFVVSVKEHEALKVDTGGTVYMQGHSLAFWLGATVTASVALTSVFWAAIIWSQL